MIPLGKLDVLLVQSAVDIESLLELPLGQSQTFHVGFEFGLEFGRQLHLLGQSSRHFRMLIFYKFVLALEVFQSESSFFALLECLAEGDGCLLRADFPFQFLSLQHGGVLLGHLP